MRILVSVFIFILLTLSSSMGAEKAQEKRRAATPDSFRCERMQDANLSALKDKLLLTCDLDRPYSIAATDNISSRTFTYCCHLKAD